MSHKKINVATFLFSAFVCRHRGYRNAKWWKLNGIDYTHAMGSRLYLEAMETATSLRAVCRICRSIVKSYCRGSETWLWAKTCRVPWTTKILFVAYVLSVCVGVCFSSLNLSKSFLANLILLYLPCVPAFVLQFNIIIIRLLCLPSLCFLNKRFFLKTFSVIIIMSSSSLLLLLLLQSVLAEQLLRTSLPYYTLFK